MIKTLKNFGALCAVESVTAVSFFIMAGMCLHAGAIDGVVVSLLVMGGAIGLGLSRYRTLTRNAVTAAPATEFERITADDLPPAPKRNRAKPAKAAPRPKRAKVKRK